LVKGFSVGDVTIRAHFCLFDQIYLALGAKLMGHFLPQDVVGNLAKIHVFRTLVRPSSIFGSKIMAQKPHFSQKSKMKSVICPLTANLASDNSAAAYARELFKTSKDA